MGRGEGRAGEGGEYWGKRVAQVNESEMVTALQTPLQPSLPSFNPQELNSEVVSTGLCPLASSWIKPMGGTRRLKDGKRMTLGYLSPRPLWAKPQLSSAIVLQPDAWVLVGAPPLATALTQSSCHHTLCLLLQALNQYHCFTRLVGSP